MREKKKSTKKHSSEFRRGYRCGKKEMDKYRSFKTADGELFGYLRSGSLRQFGKLSDWRANKGFSGGYYKAIKEAVKARPTKTRTKKSYVFYADVPKAGEYKPFVTRKQNLKIIEQHIKSKTLHAKPRKKYSIW